ncbi:MAG: hypothetical protein P4L27_06315 [Ignavibacteriaceae bacterium]|nr:hypothetical protein [Ignavibacteriaceae bacterium]
MSNLNLILFVILILLIYVQNSIRRSIKYKLKTFDINTSQLLKILKLLSLEMNDQVAEIYYNNESIFKLRKYQDGNKWGIKLYLLYDNNVEYYKIIADLMNGFRIEKENKNDSNSFSQLIIDAKSDLDKLNSAIEQLLQKTFNLSNRKKYKVLFLQKSLL